MLILTRRIGETLMIGDEVKITVLGVKGNQVRLGTTAPRDVAVHREEIYEKVQNEKDDVMPESYRKEKKSTPKIIHLKSKTT